MITRISRPSRLLLALCLPFVFSATAKAQYLITDSGAPFRTAVGYQALASNTGNYNTANGFQALILNTSGSANTSSGHQSLYSNTTGSYNVAFGQQALALNKTGTQNTASGAQSLFSNTTGSQNSANGFQALYNNTIGNTNTTSGHQSLYFNTSGNSNTASGFQALANNTTGSFNSANGSQAMFSNSTGNNNLANGSDALKSNSTGAYNTGNGMQSLYYNATGIANTADGYQALLSNTGNYNIGIGNQAGINLTTGSNNIAIGNAGVAGESNAIRIGTQNTQTAAYIAGISGVTATGGVAVYINSYGQLGTLPSSGRFKKDIQTLAGNSPKIMALRPVTFRYIKADEKGDFPLQYGLIAEEVAKVFPDLVQYDADGKPAAVFYHLLTPLLLKELQDQQAEQDKLLAENKQMEQEIAALAKSIQLDDQALVQEMTSLRQQVSTYAAQLASIQAKFNSAQQLNAGFIDTGKASVMLVGNR